MNSAKIWYRSSKLKEKKSENVYIAQKLNAFVILLQKNWTPILVII